MVNFLPMGGLAHRAHIRNGPEDSKIIPSCSLVPILTDDRLLRFDGFQSGEF